MLDQTKIVCKALLTKQGYSVSFLDLNVETLKELESLGYRIEIQEHLQTTYITEDGLVKPLTKSYKWNSYLIHNM